MLAALLLVSLGAATPVSSAGAKAQAQPFSHGLLWRVSKPGVPPSFVFGTIHIADPRVLLVPDPVKRVLTAAKRYVMEIQSNPGIEARFFEAARFDDARRLKPLIGAAAYAQVQANLRRRDVPDEVIARLKPWAALANLTITPVDYDAYTLDQNLYAQARARRLPIYGLEGIEEQISVFEGIPLDSQVALLLHGLEEREHFVGLIEPTIQAWLKRDLAALHAVPERTIARFPAMAEHYRLLNQRIVENRSVVMAHRLFTPMREGRAFVAIGANHLYGEKGVLRLLQKQGYRVTRVY